jgi:hydrogenase maturation protease
MTSGSLEPVAPYLVLAVGNSLLSDDGAGLVLLERLRRSSDWPGGVEWVDGGTQGIALLGVLAARRAVLILDAVQLGSPPGTVHVLGMDCLRRFGSSTSRTAHEGNALRLLATAELLGDLPPHVVVVGIEPESIRTGLGLSPAIGAALDEACETAGAELARIVA